MICALACHLLMTCSNLSYNFFFITLSLWIRTDRLVSLIFLDSKSRYLFNNNFCQVWKACTTRLSILTFSFIRWANFTRALDLWSKSGRATLTLDLLFKSWDWKRCDVFSNRFYNCSYSGIFCNGRGFNLLDYDAVK